MFNLISSRNKLAAASSASVGSKPTSSSFITANSSFRNKSASTANKPMSTELNRRSTKSAPADRLNNLKSIGSAASRPDPNSTESTQELSASRARPSYDSVPNASTVTTLSRNLTVSELAVDIVEPHHFRMLPPAVLPVYPERIAGPSAEVHEATSLVDMLSLETLKTGYFLLFDKPSASGEDEDGTGSQPDHVDESQLGATPFHLRYHPSRCAMTFHQYIDRLMQHANVSVSSHLLALHFLARLEQAGIIELNDYTSHKLSLTALLVATKVTEDRVRSNAYWARLGGVSTQLMNELEGEMLKMLQYRLFVSPKHVMYLARTVLHACGISTQHVGDAVLAEIDAQRERARLATEKCAYMQRREPFFSRHDSHAALRATKSLEPPSADESVSSLQSATPLTSATVSEVATDMHVLDRVRPASAPPASLVQQITSDAYVDDDDDDDDDDLEADAEQHPVRRRQQLDTWESDEATRDRRRAEIFASNDEASIRPVERVLAKDNGLGRKRHLLSSLRKLQKAHTQAHLRYHSKADRFRTRFEINEQNSGASSVFSMPEPLMSPLCDSCIDGDDDALSVIECTHAIARLDSTLSEQHAESFGDGDADHASKKQSAVEMSEASSAEYVPKLPSNDRSDASAPGGFMQRMFSLLRSPFGSSTSSASTPSSGDPYAYSSVNPAINSASAPSMDKYAFATVDSEANGTGIPDSEGRHEHIARFVPPATAPPQLGSGARATFRKAPLIKQVLTRSNSRDSGGRDRATPATGSTLTGGSSLSFQVSADSGSVGEFIPAHHRVTSMPRDEMPGRYRNAYLLSGEDSVGAASSSSNVAVTGSAVTAPISQLNGSRINGFKPWGAKLSAMRLKLSNVVGANQVPAVGSGSSFGAGPRYVASPQLVATSSSSSDISSIPGDIDAELTSSPSDEEEEQRYAYHAPAAEIGEETSEVSLPSLASEASQLHVVDQREERSSSASERAVPSEKSSDAMYEQLPPQHHHQVIQLGSRKYPSDSHFDTTSKLSSNADGRNTTNYFSGSAESLLPPTRNARASSDSAPGAGRLVQ